MHEHLHRVILGVFLWYILGISFLHTEHFFLSQNPINQGFPVRNNLLMIDPLQIRYRQCSLKSSDCA